MKINDNDINEMIEEEHKRYKFDKEFNIGLISECDGEYSSKTKKKVVEKEKTRRETISNKVYCWLF